MLINFDISQDDTDKYIDGIDSVISNKVDSIVGKKYRRKYGDVALLVSVLGEVKESRGERMAKVI